MLLTLANFGRRNNPLHDETTEDNEGRRADGMWG